MMMPANYSVIAENEMTYVNGGALADVLAPVMGAKEFQAYHKNLVMIIGNAFMQNFLDNTLKVVFGEGYVVGDAVKAIGTVLNNAYAAAAGRVTGNNILSAMAGATGVGLQVLGGLASIYALGNGEVKLGTAAFTL